MDKYRPKRPTTLALFPRLPPAGTQDSINNNSLGKKDGWKDSRSSSPHITGDLTPPDAQPKAEDKVRHGTRRLAPKPPTAGGPNSRTNTHTQSAAAAGGTHPRPRDRQLPCTAQTNSASTPRSQRRGGGGGGARGGGRGASAMRERSMGDGGTLGKEERRGGRLCLDSKAKVRERNSHQRSRDANGLKTQGADGKGKGGARGSSRGGPLNNMPNNTISSQNVYLTAMVVPRTPVAAQDQNRIQNPGQNHDRTQEAPPVLSRSSSEGGANRMSLSSDTEGPPPGPLHPVVPHRANPDITEEDGEGDPTPCLNIQGGRSIFTDFNEKQKMDCTVLESLHVAAGGQMSDSINMEDTAKRPADDGAARTEATCEAAAGFNYDSVKYTLVVDEHAQLELVSLKECLHNNNQQEDDSDSDTVYQSANEEEEPDEQEDRRQEKRQAEEQQIKEEEAKRRREEEVKRRREVVMKLTCQCKVSSTTTSEDEPNGRRVQAPRSKKFLNVFVNSSSQYSDTGAGSFGVFSCVLDGVERQQSHRAVYRFVPRHADELHLETDDPVLMLKRSEDLWCHGYNMRTGATGIFPAYYTVKVSKDVTDVHKDGWIDQFLVRFLGSVQVPFHQGNDVLCAAMQKVVCSRRAAPQPPAVCVLDVSMKGMKISVQDQCHSAHRGGQCSHFFQLKNISFCGCHPRYSKYFGFITKHPDQQRFACHVMMSEKTLHPLAESLRRAFQQYYKEHVGYSCPTEDIFID
ncbi:C-Jun-amino-terminal kinase-interacting protein 1-like [Thalassophryne amazonica]|uniref:C-Jun-amino-terminal kinase-interacting protein 1-like n=1 Tax=Thalassophryne amazonica TaxID=390379 RepID=UPI0014714B75|nr:C-Jun-amino-terminal kinase-interacting protein 1-like [Thalassophryne amazonica]